MNSLDRHSDLSGVSDRHAACHVPMSQSRNLANLPAQLRNLRAQRYSGEDFDISLSALSPVDQVHIRVLYGIAKTIHFLWMEMRDSPDWDVLRKAVTSILSPPIAISAKQLGRASMARSMPTETTPLLGKVLHDLRGGALAPLQLYARMAEWDADPVHLRSAAFLARDQAKIMRNILPDLDPELRAADEAEKPHFIQAVVEKWDQFQFSGADQAPGHVKVNCGYEGLLASCCLEASAVDRIVYNYINNAVRFTTGTSIEMDIFPVGDNAVRWVVANPIAPDQSEWLNNNTQGDLSRLFRGGLTRGGTGLGLSNCADFVAAAFGLPDIDAALDGKYLGAVVEDGWYCAWMHWPSLYTNEGSDA